jgi:hypothetical protein
MAAILKDVVLSIDSNPVVLKRPLLSAGKNLFVIPLTVIYTRLDISWPSTSYYLREYFEVKGLIINGAKSPYIDTDIDNVPIGYYTIRTDNGNTLIYVGLDADTSLIYLTQLEIIATSNSFISMFGEHDPDGEALQAFLLSLSDVKDKADALKYSKITFRQISLELIRAKESILLFGGDIVLSLIFRNLKTSSLTEFPLGRFIIDDIS